MKRCSFRPTSSWRWPCSPPRSSWCRAATRPRRCRRPARCAPAASSTRSRPTRIFDTRSRPQRGRPINDVAPLGPQADDSAIPRSTSTCSASATPSSVNPWLPASVVGSDVLAVVASITVVHPVGRRLPQRVSRRFTVAERRRRSTSAPARPSRTWRSLRPDANGHAHGRPSTASPTASAHVLIDVLGWFSTSTYTAATPTTTTDERGARLWSPSTRVASSTPGTQRPTRSVAGTERCR